MTTDRMPPRVVLAEARNHAENFPHSDGDEVRTTRLADTIEHLIDTLDAARAILAPEWERGRVLPRMIGAADQARVRALRHLLTADATPEPAEVEPEPEIEYGFYDSEHPETIYWSTFGGLLGFTTADMARHTADKSVWGRAVIVRRPRGATEHEVVPDDE